MRKTKRSGLAKAALIAGSMAMAYLVPAASRAENLADAMIGAYKSSGLLEQNRALLRAADEDLAATAAALRPVIDWTVSITRSFSERDVGLGPTRGFSTDLFAGLVLNQMIYDGGAARLARQAAQETVLATRQSLLSAEQQILLRAVRAYLNVILTSETVRLRENNLRVLREELRAAQDRFEVGEVTRTDVALAESRVANARSGLAQARGNLDNARAEYVNAVGRAPGRLAGQPRLPKVVEAEQRAVAIAMKTHPDILAAQHQVAAAEIMVQRAAKAYGPRINLRAQVGLGENLGNSNYSRTADITLGLQQRIYQGGALAAQHRRAIAARDAARAGLLMAQRNVRQGVSDALVLLRAARASLVAAREQVRAAQIAFDGLREEAKLGARTTLDVLTAEQNLLDAQTLLIQARASQSLAVYQLLAAQGLLTAERLGLAVKIYDPAAYYDMVKDAPARFSKRGKALDRVMESLGRQ